MSEVYVHEPSTRGKVVLHTSIGELDIELWSKECPKACRNFVQLCLEGYYDNTIFHRVVKDFIVQGGDPTGTGRGGADTTYDGQPFDVEVHPRLKFRYRGLVGVANLGKGGGGVATKGSGTNGNQFFITLGRADVLNNAYTLFGKITGHTLYNLMKFNDLEVGKEDRPEHPPVIRKTEVLWNPFDDIVPRKLPNRHQGGKEGSTDDERKKKKTSAAGLGGVKKKRHLREEETDEEDEQHEGRTKLAKKDGKLLSFAAEEEEEEEEEEGEEEGAENGKENGIKKKTLSAHDILNDPQLLRTKPEEEEDEYEEEERRYYERIENRGSLAGVRSRLAQLSSSNDGPRPDHTSDEESASDSSEGNSRRKTSLSSRERRTGGSSQEASSPDAGRSDPSSSGDEKNTKTKRGPSTNAPESSRRGRSATGREERVEALRFKRASLGGGEAGKKADDRGGGDGLVNGDLMTETEKRRQRFLVRSKDVGRKQRQDMTLKKLDAFTEQLRRLRETSSTASKKGSEKEGGDEKKPSVKSDKEAGTLNAILPDLDEEVEENDGSWLQNGGLRFAVDSARAYELDEARAAASVVVYDPLKGLSADARRQMAEERKKQQARGWKEGVRDVPKW